MRTLFIAPQVPYPPDVGSKIRTLNLLRCYAEIGPVTLLCLTWEPGDEVAVKSLSPYCAEIHCLPGKAIPIASGAAEVIKRVARPAPAFVQHPASSEMPAAAERLLKETHFDFVHIERLAMTGALDFKLPTSRGGRPLLVLDVDDLESAKAMRSARLTSWRSRRKFVDIIEAWKLWRYESRHFPRFDQLLVCSERDQQAVLNRLSAHPDVDVAIFRNGADSRELAQDMTAMDDSRTLLFLGAMNYPPNEDAALYFVQRVLPLIRASRPEVRFVIAGRSPSPAVSALHDGQTIIVAGYVSDKFALLRECAVFVTPLRMGGGTRIKIIEAMMAGRPVVSTRVGCEGLDVTDDQDIMIADDPKDFADECLRLLGNSALRDRLGSSAQKLARTRYDWERIRSEHAMRLTQAHSLGSENGTRAGRSDPASIRAHDH